MITLVYFMAWLVVADLADRYARRLRVPVSLPDVFGIFWLILALLILVSGGPDFFDRILPLALVAVAHLHLVRSGNAPVGWRDLTRHMVDRLRQAVQSFRRRFGT